MSIAFFTEGGYTGKVPRNMPMRTDQAWVCALDAVHHCVFKLNEVNQKYDIGVVIIPKEKNREHLVKQQYPLIDNIRNYCDKVIILPKTNSITSAIIYSLPIQLIAYHLGLILGTDIDQPRNLAKSVTVE